MSKKVKRIEQEIIDDVFEYAMGQFWDSVNSELREKYDMSENLLDKYYDEISFQLKTCYNDDVV